MKFIQVSDQYWTNPNAITSTDGKRWALARPELLIPNLLEKTLHYFGKHLSYGQPYCVICGKSEIVFRMEGEK